MRAAFPRRLHHLRWHQSRWCSWPYVGHLLQDAPSLITARFVSTRAEAIEIAAASPVPWSCLFPGSSYKGTVMARGDYGLLVQLDAGYKGLVPRSAFENSLESHQTVTAKTASWNALPHRGDRVSAYLVAKNRDTGKVSLSLEPPREVIKPLKQLILDGREPYIGCVTAINSIGAFFHLGFERQGLLRRDGLDEESEAIFDSLEVGQQKTIFVTEFNKATSKIGLSLRSKSTPLQLFKDIVADGQTAYPGIVRTTTKDSACIDIGTSCTAHLQDKNHNLSNGDAVNIFITRKVRRSGFIRASLTPTSEQLLRVRELVVDGRTMYSGRIERFTREGDAMVGFGCEEGALLRSSDPLFQHRAARVGDAVGIYLCWKSPLIVATTVPKRERLASADDIKADGVTLYKAVVTGSSPTSTFLDIGCELGGYLHQGLENGPVDPQEDQAVNRTYMVGDEVAVYVWFRQRDKLYVCLAPRPTPGLSLDELVADGVTPVQATVLSRRGTSVWVDVGCDTLGLLLPTDFHSSAEDVQELQSRDPRQDGKSSIDRHIVGEQQYLVRTFSIRLISLVDCRKKSEAKEHANCLHVLVETDSGAMVPSVALDAEVAPKLK